MYGISQQSARCLIRHAPKTALRPSGMGWTAQAINIRPFHKAHALSFRRHEAARYPGKASGDIKSSEEHSPSFLSDETTAPEESESHVALKEDSTISSNSANGNESVEAMQTRIDRLEALIQSMKTNDASSSQIQEFSEEAEEDADMPAIFSTPSPSISSPKSSPENSKSSSESLQGATEEPPTSLDPSISPFPSPDSASPSPPAEKRHPFPERINSLPLANPHLEPTQPIDISKIHFSKGDGADLTDRLSRLTSWALNSTGTGLIRTFKFQTFADCWRFMCLTAAQCKSTKHHPSWWNCYNKVTVEWTTHEPHGLSRRDVQMAEWCDDKAARIGVVGEKKKKWKGKEVEREEERLRVLERQGKGQKVGRKWVERGDPFDDK